MYATRALLPPMLQNLMNYPVATTGLVTAPSGVGTMIAMMCAGRLLKRVDARLLLLAGFADLRVLALADDALHDRAVAHRTSSGRA